MNDLEIIINNAKVAVGQNRLDEALSFLDKPLLESNADAVFLKGEIYFKLQKWGEALNYFSLFLEQFPTDVRAKSYCIMINDILGFYHKDLYNP